VIAHAIALALSLATPPPTTSALPGRKARPAAPSRFQDAKLRILDAGLIGCFGASQDLGGSFSTTEEETLCIHRDGHASLARVVTTFAFGHRGVSEKLDVGAVVVGPDAMMLLAVRHEPEAEAGKVVASGWHFRIVPEGLVLEGRLYGRTEAAAPDGPEVFADGSHDEDAEVAVADPEVSSPPGGDARGDE
jgi:hypothetical protein